MGLAVIGIFFEVRHLFFLSLSPFFFPSLSFSHEIVVPFGCYLLLQITEEDNEALKPVIDALASIPVGGDSVSIKIDINPMFDGIDLGSYYSYSGSLTTPPCFETVTWLVMKDVSTVSEAQLQALREIYQSDGSTPITINYRPVQPINGRAVFGASGSINSALAQQLSALDALAANLSQAEEASDEDNETIIIIQAVTLAVAFLALIGVVLVAMKMGTTSGSSCSTSEPPKSVSDAKPARGPLKPGKGEPTNGTP